ncbi:hypothetical protein HK096_001908, partial [Nowakowskiella sp. JEL0078]
SNLVRRFLGMESPLTITENRDSTSNQSAVNAQQFSPIATSNSVSSRMSNTPQAYISEGHPAGYVPVWVVSHFLLFYDTYLPAGSEHEVNIPGTLRKRITDTLVSGGAYKIPVTIFDEAADEVMRMLYLNTFARFVQLKRGPSQTGQRNRMN